MCNCINRWHLRQTPLTIDIFHVKCAAREEDKFAESCYRSQSKQVLIKKAFEWHLFTSFMFHCINEMTLKRTLMENWRSLFFIMFSFLFCSWNKFFCFVGWTNYFLLFISDWKMNWHQTILKRFPQTEMKNYQLAARIDLSLNTCFDVRALIQKSWIYSSPWLPRGFRPKMIRTLLAVFSASAVSCPT